ncbi:MAG TPA: hypothetical protein VGD84_25605 [Pseudonocardiaceae bacterium]
METMVGFVIGYYFGTRHGREGLNQAIAALDAIRQSPQTKELVGTAYAAAQPLIKQLTAGGTGAVVTSVVEELGRRMSRAA